jgi:hypothetical protein
VSVPSLAAWGIQHPDDVIAQAQTAGLPLAVAASLLEQESGGGHNVWGSDGVDTGGAYVKGAPVTREAYLAYRQLVKAGKIGHQGVGPVQLTAEVYQARADALGGGWDPVVNMRVGFMALADLIHAYGVADGVRRYNGSGPAALAYRDRMLGRIAKWADRLGPTPIQEDDMPLSDTDVARIAVAVQERILKTPLRDLYPSDPKAPPQTMDLATTVQWAAANAGRALDAARAAATALARLEAAGAATPVGEVNTAIRQALDALGPLELVPTRELDHGAAQ